MDYRIEEKQVERVARLYKSNKEASLALGITRGHFGRLCRKLGIKTPYARSHHGRNGSARPTPAN